MSGKGSAPRPFSVSNEEYANRWDAIFGKDKREEALQKMVEDSQRLGLYEEHLELPFCDCPGFCTGQCGNVG